jgi:hypothetical protein
MRNGAPRGRAGARPSTSSRPVVCQSRTGPGRARAPRATPTEACSTRCHNDSKIEDPNRGTDPYTTYQQYLRGYLEVARLHRANPVLVTSVERRRFKDGKPVETLGEYPEAMRALAEEENVPLIDLQAASLDLWNQLGEEGTKDHFLWIDPGHEHYPDGIQDNTHFQATGAIEVARLIAKAAGRQHLMKGAFEGLHQDADPADITWPESISEPPL